jgi:hypothetical protein
MKRKFIIFYVALLSVFCLCLAAIVIAFWVNPAAQKAFSNVGNMFGDLLALQQKVAEKYQCDVQVKINNTDTLVVTLVNSGLNELLPAQQERKAKEIALFVKSNYAGLADIKQIVIGFSVLNQVGPISSWQQSYYPFPVAELK